MSNTNSTVKQTPHVKRAVAATARRNLRESFGLSGRQRRENLNIEEAALLEESLRAAERWDTVKIVI